MIYRNVFVSNSQASYCLVFESELASSFIRVKVMEIVDEEPKLVMAALVRWDDLSTVQYLGRVKAAHTAELLGVLERELEALISGLNRFPNMLLH
jgi:hypothetical protein